MNTLSSVLVFPIDMAQSVAFAVTARELGLKVIMATSDIMESAKRSEDVVHLPYITDPKFNDAFICLLKRERITQVFTPHATIWSYFQSLSQDDGFSVKFKVCNESPIAMDKKPFDVAYEWAESCIFGLNMSAEELAAPLSPHLYANLHLAFNRIPGQSDDCKLSLLAHIARQSLQGDVIEIGSYYGRSAFALAWLAKWHNLGTVICIDPWKAESSRDQGIAAKLVNQAGEELDWDQVFLGFIASVGSFHNVNYIRNSSMLALSEYRLAASAGLIQSDEFGATPVCGSISILHIDGNHKYEEIKQDILAWVPLVKKGGWVLVDDYLWAFGDGPKQAGDELLQERAIKTAFVAGDTLCIQL
ncbi:class I SAM-dependent methyltransferase [Pollutimonas bauzanensis]|uniref:class I SAM-dependent methyltransferase n=1 Tax=Pollutimonas bauzanensis TaxID=658167 RepID=UPI0015B52354|nr:class I SAM-dependent methyltransferase [Pollutimonas bauzanensis]